MQEEKKKLAKLRVLKLYSNIQSGNSSEALLDIINELIDNLNDIPKGDQGEKGEKGDKGDKGDNGKDGINGRDGKDGKDGRNGRDGKDGIDGLDGKDGVDGKNATEIDINKLIVDTVNYIESREGEERIDAKAIKNLPEFTREVVREVGQHFIETPIKSGTNTTVRKDASGAWVIDASGGSSSGITRSINNISTDTTAGNTPSVDYEYNCTGPLTVTLPTAVNNTNKYTVTRISGLITVNTTSSQTINGSLSATLTINNMSLDFVSDGSNWIIK